MEQPRTRCSNGLSELAACITGGSLTRLSLRGTADKEKKGVYSAMATAEREAIRKYDVRYSVPISVAMLFNSGGLWN